MCSKGVKTYKFIALLTSIQFVESQFQLRTPEKHSDHCDLVEQEDLSSLDQQHYSATFGVNRRALLNSLRYFDVTSGALIPDIMHDILEGALPLEMKCMLKVQSKFQNKFLFTLLSQRSLLLTKSYLH